MPRTAIPILALACLLVGGCEKKQSLPFRAATFQIVERLEDKMDSLKE